MEAEESAGAEIRQAEEEWLLRIWREFRGKVSDLPIERASQYDRAKLAESLASFLKGAGIGPPPSPPASNGFLNSLQSGVAENLASHFSDNPYRSDSIGDDRARWRSSESSVISLNALFAINANSRDQSALASQCATTARLNLHFHSPKLPIGGPILTIGRTIFDIWPGHL